MSDCQSVIKYLPDKIWKTYGGLFAKSMFIKIFNKREREREC